MARKADRRPKLKLARVAKRRTTYAARTRQNGRAAAPLLAALNGHAEASWNHETIRLALLRQQVVEIDDLAAELPRPAILHAVAKGWLYRVAGEDWLRITRRGASDLNLPPRRSDGRKITFFDAAKLPSSAAVFPEPAKREVSETRAAELVAAMRAPLAPLAASALYRAAIAETGWKPADIARRIGGDDQKLVNATWDRVIWCVLLAEMTPEVQTAADAGALTLPAVGQLSRVPAARRGELYAAIRDGQLKSFAAVKRAADALIREAP